MKRAVITGAGAVSAFGVGLGALLDGLAAGRGAVGPIRSFDASHFPTRVAGEVPVAHTDAAWVREHIDDESRADAWERAGMLRDRKVAFAVIAAAEAWRTAGCGPAEREAWLAIALGLEHALLEDFALLFRTAGRDDERAWQAEPSLPLPPVRLRTPVDLAARAVGDLLALTGPTVVHVSACAAGALAVAQAASLIERGDADVVVCGGSDSMVNPLGVGGLARIGAPSPRNAPDACRPFDRRRDGLAVGEGAAMFIVEEEGRARSRKARPLARVLGWGSTQDAFRPTAPRPGGERAAAAMRSALHRAGLAPSSVDYINAHGTGTPLNDPAEARAIHAALGEHAARVPTSSIKGAIGHLMAASGAVELAACLLAFQRDLLPGTATHRERDPECDLDVIGETPRPARARVVVSNSFGFGGQNATLVLGRPA